MFYYKYLYKTLIKKDKYIKNTYNKYIRNKMLKYILFIININIICVGCCCKNTNVNNNDSNTDNNKNNNDPYDYKIQFIKKKDIEKLLDPNSDIVNEKNFIKQKYNTYINNLKKVINLIKNEFNYNYLNNEPKFPHIHWNGNVNNHYNHLCFMLAPLNVLLHLDKIKEFFKSNPEPKDNKLTDNSNINLYLEYKYWIEIFKLYIDRLENGYSFTLDPQKDKEGNPYNIYLLGLEGKANVLESIDVSNKFFDTINKYNHNYKFSNILLEDKSDSPEKIIEYKKIINEFINEQKNEENNLDIIYLNTQRLLCTKKNNNFFEDQTEVINITETFKYSENTYHLDGLIYFGTNDNNVDNNNNDVFSFVYDKNAPDKNKPYVFCQLNYPMKYYSLQEIENGMKPNNTSISSYKQHHLIASAFSKID